MGTLDEKNSEENNEVEYDAEDHGESSFKNAMYTSIIFVGGGIVSFWILLFMIFTARG